MIDTEHNGISEEDKKQMKDDEREIRETLPLFESLVKSKGWAKLVEVAQKTLTSRENYALYSTDKELEKMDMERTQLRGEASGIRLILALPDILMQQYAEVLDEIIDEEDEDGK